MKPSRINILIACEESQAECKAFRERGFRAFSCDLQKPRYELKWHILGDVTPYLQGRTKFKTMDGKRHSIKRWHLIIAHPPCTYLCKVSSLWMVQKGIINKNRFDLMLEARKFFYQCLAAKANYVAVENPLPMARAELPKPSFYVCPSWFGHKYTKKTLYWVKGLPPIFAVIDYPGAKSFCNHSRGKYRSRTFEGVAEALAKQWGDFLIENL